MNKLTQRVLLFVCIMAVSIANTQAQTIEDIKAQIVEETESMSKDELEAYLIKSAQQFKSVLAINALVGEMQKEQNGQDLGDDSDEDDTPYQLADRLAKDDFKISFTQEANQFTQGSIFRRQVVGKASHTDFEYEINKVYFEDGTVMTDKQDEMLAQRRLESRNPVDSVEISINYTYPLSLTEVKLSANEPQAIFQGDTIKLEKLDFNFARLTMGANTSEKLLKVTGKTKTGKVTTTKQTASGAPQPESTGKVLESFSEALDAVAAKIEDKKYATKQNLTDDLFNMLEKFYNEFQLETSDQRFWQGSFNANIDTLSIFIANDMNTENYTMTVPVTLDSSMLTTGEEEE